MKERHVAELGQFQQKLLSALQKQPKYSKELLVRCWATYVLAILLCGLLLVRSIHQP